MNAKLAKFKSDLTAFAQAIRSDDHRVIEPTGRDIPDWPRERVVQDVARENDLDYCRECFRLVAKGTGHMDADGRILCEICK